MVVSDLTHPTGDTDKTLKEVPRLKDKKEKPLTKIIVRRLPPVIDKETFLLQVSPIPDYDYLYIVRGDSSLGDNAFSRVYINFIQPSDIFMFKEKFDNYIFVDQKGHEYPAVVEFASFQKIPRKRKPRLDPKVSSIESDPCYVEFVESLKEQPNQDVKPEFSYQFGNETKDEVATTPLLDYIKQRRIDKQRIREERREERRKRELERKKLREEERKKYEYKSSAKTVKNTSNRPSKSVLDMVKEETGAKSEVKAKDEDSLVKEDDKTYFKPKPRFPRPEKVDYYDKRPDYKRRDDYREKEFRSRRFEEYKKEQDPKAAPRRTKKYSEKREERKNEAKKAEQKIIEESEEKVLEAPVSVQDEIRSNPDNEDKEFNNVSEENEVIFDKKLEPQTSTEYEDENPRDDRERNKNKENDPRLQRRIRNKDRPTMAIYQPGMLSKRRTSDDIDVSLLKE
ncbi:hypothetical protein FQA39_LY04226 [Lamprigera yunnana]|nr:hypothetical protein FQA39_LY04226 [Lamprigera yunnana]